MPKTEIDLRLPRPKDAIETAVFEGIMTGVSDGAANLLKVANSDAIIDEATPERRAKRARAGLIKLKASAEMMLTLADEVFGDEANAKQDLPS